MIADNKTLIAEGIFAITATKLVGEVWKCRVMCRTNLDSPNSVTYEGKGERFEDSMRDAVEGARSMIKELIYKLSDKNPHERSKTHYRPRQVQIR